MVAYVIIVIETSQGLHIMTVLSDLITLISNGNDDLARLDSAVNGVAGTWLDKDGVPVKNLKQRLDELGILTVTATDGAAADATFDVATQTLALVLPKGDTGADSTVPGPVGPGVDFNPVAVSGTTPSLDLSSYNFFMHTGGGLTPTVSFTGSPLAKRWTYAVDIETFSGEPTLVGNSGATRHILTTPDGTRSYLSVSAFSTTIEQYELSTAWDYSTVGVASASRDFGAELSRVDCAVMSPDGTILYIHDGTSDETHQYNLSVAFDITSATYASKDADFGDLTSHYTTTDMYLKSDGTAMYFIQSAGDSVHMLTLSTPFDISTASYDVDDDVYTSGQESSSSGISISDDGTRLYTVGTSTGDLHRYIMSTPWDLQTMTYEGVVGALSVTPGKLTMSSDESKMASGGASYAINNSIDVQWPASVVNPPNIDSDGLGGLLVVTFVTMDTGATVYVIESGIT
jgi:hypothetical protein